MAKIPKRLLLSYAVDWALVVILFAGGGVLNYITGYHRPFTLTEYDIAYPHRPDIVSIPVVIIVALVAPALIIIALSLLAVPSPKTATVPFHSRWHTALWNANSGCLGLAMALSITLFITSGLKDIVGKPRPDLLDRCNADLTKISDFSVGGFGMSLDSEAEPLVSDGICQQSNSRLLDDGFAAFPSGHSSFSSAGMVYLSLWLCARLPVAIPSLNSSTRAVPHHAAPPIWQTIVALVPIGTAMFICASRYADFHHAGIDIFVGALIGTAVAWFSFRMYHLPLGYGNGTIAWEPRTPQDAFFPGTSNEGNGDVGVQDRFEGSGNIGEAHAMSSMGRDNARPPESRATDSNSDDPILRARIERV